MKHQRYFDMKGCVDAADSKTQLIHVAGGYSTAFVFVNREGRFSWPLQESGF